MQPGLRALLLCVVAAAWPLGVAQGQSPSSVGSLLGPARPTADPYPELRALEAQLQEVAGRPDAQVAAEPIALAKTALARARHLRRERQHDAAERQQQIAAAALSAAGYVIARHRAEQELAAVRRRAALVQAAADAAHAALEHTRTQLARQQAGSSP